MSHGPTRRLQRLINQGGVSAEVLAAADHEADLLGHPYVGVEHLELGRLRLAGRRADADALCASITAGVPRRWWRPRGPRSALRRDGRRRTRAAQEAAREADGT